MSFGTRIKLLRQNKNMTQEDLAKILKVSRSAIGRYENDERFPDKDILIKLADVFEVSLDYLLLRSNDSKSFYTEDYSLVREYPDTIYDYITKVISEENFDAELISLEKINLNDNFMKNTILYGIYAAIKMESISK